MSPETTPSKIPSALWLLAVLLAFGAGWFANGRFNSTGRFQFQFYETGTVVYRMDTANGQIDVVTLSGRQVLQVAPPAR